MTDLVLELAAEHADAKRLNHVLLQTIRELAGMVCAHRDQVIRAAIEQTLCAHTVAPTRQSIRAGALAVLGAMVDAELDEMIAAIERERKDEAA